ncbi:WXG100 family type VII secretion target [Corynebacterium tapiri]|uniref:ESAT-6-like protein n=1 Tax=Corynebacterium tapiri TaxID=1448266 RepID=A0A5C4U4A6_9CORY|nr:WXG100 family type VII secretion target [Corynebacterium tapiri]TNL98519.1 WXG100 family type VII secretion target [Corynebacterium tapiri]
MTQLFTTEAEVMVSTAANVDDTNARVQGELSRLADVVDTLRGSWAGTAQASFDNLMERYDAAAQRLQQALTSIAENLRSNAGNFSDVEASNETAFNSVASGLNL